MYNAFPEQSELIKRFFLSETLPQNNDEAKKNDLIINPIEKHFTDYFLQMQSSSHHIDSDDMFHQLTSDNDLNSITFYMNNTYYSKVKPFEYIPSEFSSANIEYLKVDDKVIVTSIDNILSFSKCFDGEDIKVDKDVLTSFPPLTTSLSDDEEEEQINDTEIKFKELKRNDSTSTQSITDTEVTSENNTSSIFGVTKWFSFF